MANTTLIFHGDEGTELTVHGEMTNIHLTIYDDEHAKQITLDVPTAIKFSKVLRHEISKAKQIKEELENGRK